MDMDDVQTLHDEVVAVIAEMEEQPSSNPRHVHKLRVAYAARAETCRRLGLEVPHKGIGIVERMFKVYAQQAFDEAIREEFGDQVIDRIKRESDSNAMDVLEDWVLNQSEVGIGAFERFRDNYNATP